MSYYGTTCDLADAEAKRIVENFWQECREAGLSGIDIIQILEEAIEKLVASMPDFKQYLEEVREEMELRRRQAGLGNADKLPF
jgi:hypothetical protein